MSKYGFETRAIHGSGFSPPGFPAVDGAVYQTSSFGYPDSEGLTDVFAGRKPGYIYSRIANPTVSVLEDRLTQLENGRGTVALASGMAAISAVAWTLTDPGSEIVVSRSLFGGTRQLFDRILGRFGILPRYVNASDTKGFLQAINDKTRFVYVETLGNPLADIPDIRTIADGAHKQGIPLVVDGTLTTPYLFKAGENGVDIVIHSTTKYLAGGGNTIGGALVDTGRFSWKDFPGKAFDVLKGKVHPDLLFLAALRREVYTNTGAVLSPQTAQLQIHGLETLSLRMDRHCRSALSLARYLEGHGDVAAVHYPALESSPYHSLAEQLYGGAGGGVLSFDVGEEQKAIAVINQLKLAKRQTNLGDSRTLVIHPASTIFRDLTPEDKTEAGITSGLIRVSVGLETENDILSDFEQALEDIE